jgi:uncharacterized protein (TIGR02266 family)
MPYWLQDGVGRVLGPIGLDVVRDLVLADRVQSIELVSTDGRSWAPASKYREISQLLVERTRRDDDLAEAARLRNLIIEMRDKPPHEIFGLSPHDSVDAYRQAFFELVKRYHPERLPPGAHPDLAAAHDEIFHFLGATLVRIETIKGATPGSTSSAQGAAKANAGADRRYGPEEFVGLQRSADGQARANIKVSLANAGMFTEHRVMNLSRGGFFMAGASLPLGSVVDVVFHFDDPPKEIKVRGKVVWESVGIGRAAAGLGIKFLTLQDPDLAFLQEFLGRLQQPAS